LNRAKAAKNAFLKKKTQFFAFFAPLRFRLSVRAPRSNRLNRKGHHNVYFF
jgi:hypothetical protein